MLVKWIKILEVPSLTHTYMTFLNYTIDHKPGIKWCVVRVLLLFIRLVVRGRVILKHQGRVLGW